MNVCPCGQDRVVEFVSEPVPVQTMSTKAVAISRPLDSNEAGSRLVAECFAEMGQIRKRMKSADERIRRADAEIRRSLDDTRAVLRHVQTIR